MHLSLYSLLASLALQKLPLQVHGRALPDTVPGACVGQSCSLSPFSFDPRAWSAQHPQDANFPVDDMPASLGSEDSFERIARRAKSPSSSSSDTGSPNSPNSPSTNNNPLIPDLPPQAAGQPGSPLFLSKVAQPSNPGAPLFLSGVPTATRSGGPDASASPSNPVQTTPATAGGGNSPTDVCKRSTSSLSRRCALPESADEIASDNGDRSDPQDAPQESRPNPNNWYSKIEAGASQRARTQFEERKKNNGPDQEFPSFVDKYKVDDIENLDGMFNGFDSGLTRQTIKKVFDSIDPNISSSQVKARTNFLSSKTTDSGFMQVNTFSKDGRIIIADVNDVNQDGNQKDFRVRWNRFIIEQYRNLMEEHRLGTDNLQLMGRSRISNRATKTTLQTAIRNGYGRDSTGPDFDKDQVFRFGSDSDNPVEKTAFDALSFSDNVNGVWWTLTNFYQTLGKKTITAIRGRLDKGDPENEGVVADLVLEFGPA